MHGDCLGCSARAHQISCHYLKESIMPGRPIEDRSRRNAIQEELIKISNNHLVSHLMYNQSVRLPGFFDALDIQ